jgi:hypothetical protein
LLQELISTPVGLFWTTISSLEILRGGRAASATGGVPKQEALAHGSSFC